jgi:hypothetical protein
LKKINNGSVKPALSDEYNPSDWITFNYNWKEYIKPDTLVNAWSLLAENRQQTIKIFWWILNVSPGGKYLYTDY